MLEDWTGPPTWQLHTRLSFCVEHFDKFSALGQRTRLKLGELSSLFIVYNITIFWLHPLDSFLFCFPLCDSAHTLYFLFWLCLHLPWMKEQEINMFCVILFHDIHNVVILLGKRKINFEHLCIRAGIWHFPKHCSQIPYLKNVQSNKTEIPHPRKCFVVTMPHLPHPPPAWHW